MTGGLWELSSTVRVDAIDAQPGGSRPARVNPSSSDKQSLRFGTSSGRFTEAADWTEVLDPGQSKTIDLWSGTIANVFGEPAVFANLRSFRAFVAAGGDSSGVKIAPGVSNGNSLWWGGTTPYKTIYPDGPAEVGGSPAGVGVSAAAANVTLTNLGTVAASVRISLAGLGPMGANFFPGSLLSLGIG